MTSVEVIKEEENKDRLELLHRANLQMLLIAKLFGGDPQTPSPEAEEWMTAHNKTISNLIDNNKDTDVESKHIRELCRQGTWSGYLGAAQLLLSMLPKEIIPLDLAPRDWPKEGEFQLGK